LSRSSAAVDAAADPAGKTNARSLFVLIAHLARIALGAVYLLAAATKAPHPTLFAEQIAEYGITPEAWSIWQAPLFIVLEFALGAALIANFRPRLTIPFGTALMVFFIGVLTVAMANGYDGSCGCFGGASTRGPVDALLEDVVFLAAGVVAWLGMRLDGGFARRGRSRWQAAVAVLGLALGIAAYVVGPRLPLAKLATAGRAGAAFDHIIVEELDMDLTRGEYLVAILDPAAEASVEAVQPLNALVGEGPPVVGVFEGDNEQMVSFLFEHYPAFDGMGHAPHVATRRFYRRLPVVLALRDGIIEEAWHERVPDTDEVTAAFP